ncbi:sre G protein-coupled chemoreceptor domain-containing protein [Ditylenchus destructor]|nr:sre G protein-coupled chemoreceptor domain-containing protein [Ditylenchus destructor]
MAVAWLTYPNVVDKFRIALFTVEIIVLTSAIFVNVFLFLTVIKRTQTVHRNMKCLFHNFVINTAIIAFTRFIIIANMISQMTFLDKEGIFYRSVACIHDIGMAMDATNQWGLAFERTLSTFFSRTYERNRSKCLTAFIAILPWCPAIAHGIVLHSGIIDGRKTGFSMAGLNVAAWVVFIFLSAANKLKYKRGMSDNLSERYQIVENIKTMPMVYVFIFACAIRNILAIAITLAIDYIFLNHELFYWYRVMGNLYDLIVGSYALITPLLIMHSHAEMHRRLRLLLAMSTDVSPLPNDQPLKGVRGDLLMLDFGLSEYFEHLNHCWEAHFQTQQVKRFGVF